MPLLLFVIVLVCSTGFFLQVLGEGTYATVRYAVNVDTKEPVAVKIIDRVKIADPAMAEQLKREISIMKKIRHPNVVRLNEGAYVCLFLVWTDGWMDGWMATSIAAWLWIGQSTCVCDVILLQCFRAGPRSSSSSST